MGPALPPALPSRQQAPARVRSKTCAWQVPRTRLTGQGSWGNGQQKPLPHGGRAPPSPKGPGQTPDEAAGHLPRGDSYRPETAGTGARETPQGRAPSLCIPEHRWAQPWASSEGQSLRQTTRGTGRSSGTGVPSRRASAPGPTGRRTRPRAALTPLCTRVLGRQESQTRERKRHPASRKGKQMGVRVTGSPTATPAPLPEAQSRAAGAAAQGCARRCVP